MSALLETISSTFIDCRPLKEQTKEKLMTRLDKLEPPKVAIVQIGRNKGASSYRHQLVTDAAALGINCNVTYLPKPGSYNEIKEAIQDISNDPQVDGVIPIRPIPSELLTAWQMSKEDTIFQPLVEKDIDNEFDLRGKKRFSGVVEAEKEILQAIVDLAQLESAPHEQRRGVIIGRGTVGRSTYRMLREVFGSKLDIRMVDIQTPHREILIGHGKLVFGCANVAGVYPLNILNRHAVVIDPGWNFDQATSNFPIGFDGLITSNEKGQGVGPLASLCTFRNLLDRIEERADHANKTNSLPSSHVYPLQVNA